MGVYYYTINPSKIKASVYGEKKTIYQMSFRFGQYTSANKAEEKYMDRCYRTAKKVGEKPDYCGLVYWGTKEVGDKYVPFDGADVYQLDQFVYDWVDNGPIRGKVIGRLKKINNRWHVVPTEQMPNIDELELFWREKDLSKLPQSAFCFHHITNTDTDFNQICLVKLDENNEYISYHVRQQDNTVYSVTEKGRENWLVAKAKEVAKDFKGPKNVYFNGTHNDIIVQY